MDATLPPAQRAGLLVAQMLLDEKIAMVHGSPGPYVGNTTNINRLGIPALHLQDGPAGVADGVQGVTALPAPILLAATWDTSLARQYGTIIGAEARGKGVHVSLGPMINLVRVPQGGRSFETFGEDPFLTAAMAAEHIRGIQSQGCIANAKHFVCNDQEDTRGNENTHVDERTLHEIYFPPFLAAVRAGVGSICGAYNSVNGKWSSESPLLGVVIKTMWGFDGFVECDWGANFSMQHAIDNGLDLEMPYDTRFGSPLSNSLDSGAISVSQLDEMVQRILIPMFRFGIFDNPPAGTVSTVVTSPDHAAFARNVATKGMVLLKNAGGLLPLNSASLHSIAVSGSVASTNPIWTGTGSAQVYLPYYDIPLNAISNRAGTNVIITYDQGDSGGSIAAAVEAAQQADVAIVCVGEQTGEGADRASLSLPADQDALVSAVASANPHTIVVLYASAGTLTPWIDQVPAALVAWFPGQENGNPLASILFGDVNPSGKLPVTFPASSNQVPANTISQYPGTNLQVFYSEGLLMGYRWYDASNLAPQFPFGHGLSYTTFDYSNLVVSAVSPSGQVTIEMDLKNTGNRVGSEIAQLYLGFPPAAGEPPLQLKGFKKIFLVPGATKHVTFNLDWEDIARWDEVAHQWTVPVGVFNVFVGASSRDIRLRGSFIVSSLIPSSGVANRALFHPVTVSSGSNSGFMAVDGDPSTFWSSSGDGPQWITVDLGTTNNIVRVRLKWDANYARSYQIQISNNSNNWISVYSTTNGVGGTEDLVIERAGRYVRLYGTQSATGLGYSLQELEVYSSKVQIFPQLSVRYSNTNSMLLSWPASSGVSELQQNAWLNWGGYVLQQASEMPTTNWIDFSDSPTTVNGTNQVTISLLPKHQFYRLRSP
jgi:beta-glucosidase